MEYVAIIYTLKMQAKKETVISGTRHKLTYIYRIILLRVYSAEYHGLYIL